MQNNSVRIIFVLKKMRTLRFAHPTRFISARVTEHKQPYAWFMVKGYMLFLRRFFPNTFGTINKGINHVLG